MTALWTAFELLVNLYQAAVSAYFVFAFLSGKGIRSFFNLENLIAILINFFIICLDTYIDFGKFICLGNGIKVCLSMHAR